MKTKTILLLILIIIAVVIFLKTIDKCRRKCRRHLPEYAENTESDDSETKDSDADNTATENSDASDSDTDDEKEKFIVEDILGSFDFKENKKMEKTKTDYSKQFIPPSTSNATISSSVSTETSPTTETPTSSTENSNSMIALAAQKLKDGASTVKNLLGFGDQPQTSSTFTEYTGNPDNRNIKNKMIDSSNFKTYAPPSNSTLANGGCSCSRRGNAYTDTETEQDYESASAVTKHVDSRVLVPKAGDIQGFNSFSVEYPVSQGTYTQ